MVDNVKVLPTVDPSGVSMRTDDVGGIHYPVQKLAVGGDGVADMISADNAVPTIDNMVQSAVNGAVFFGTQIVTAVADTASVYWLILTGTAETFLKFGMVSAGFLETYLSEGPTTSIDGTVQANFNAKRDDVLTAMQTLVYFAPTFSAVGTVLSSELVPGATKKLVGSAAAESRLLLKANTRYLIEIINVSGGAVDVGVDWLLRES